MATGTRRGGDIVLAGRHIVGMFLVLMVLFGLVFTLGYVLGRSQYDMQLRAAASTVSSGFDEPAEDPAAGSPTLIEGQSTPPAADWEFYRSAEPSKPPERLLVKPKPVPAPNRAATPAPAKASRSMNAPLIPRGATVLQVAALLHEADALALAQALQQEEFPAFVLNPSTDHYYRVQVGPYGDAQSVNAARRRLESHGFETIVRR